MTPEQIEAGRARERAKYANDRNTESGTAKGSESGTQTIRNFDSGTASDSGSPIRRRSG
jgi:hypothetical protein